MRKERKRQHKKDVMKLNQVSGRKESQNKSLKNERKKKRRRKENEKERQRPRRNSECPV